ncbi:MAG: diaminopimelate epimerase [Paludibacteraceae bacterium]|nr:diaminopimelate epimerase [Paludibacteraceae bacterium]
MQFTKMHGISNDYVYVNGFKETVANPGEVAIKVSDRHTGIGSDGLVLILPSETCDFRMRMFNADGSEAEMCGNASRCVGKYVYDNGLTTKTSVTLETKAGVKILNLHLGADGKVESVTVDMGEPILEPGLVPVVSSLKQVVSQPIQVLGVDYKFTAVSMGNPHAVIFMEQSVEDFPLEKIGPHFENHEFFPRRTNTEFVNIIDRQTLRMRVWERGAGETMACGTGACGTAVAAILNGITDRKVTIKLNGGDLLIEWDEKTNHVFMTGGATTVFTGSIDV